MNDKQNKSVEERATGPQSEHLPQDRSFADRWARRAHHRLLNNNQANRRDDNWPFRQRRRRRPYHRRQLPATG